MAVVEKKQKREKRARALVQPLVEASKAGPETQDDGVEPLNPAASAKAAGLRYVTDHKAGIRRHAHGKDGKTFSYTTDPNGEDVTDDTTLGRIKSLVIPPAWTDVWICKQPNGHLQATGRDARGRKQSRYHPKWR
ncbi:MAG: DNA topoisomerase IB, partial [Rhodospirillales bacterium]|nr:DNA topoisomerase IB [Acetobacter sp.]